MKKRIKLITCISFIILLLVTGICLKDRIRIEATVLKAERQYAETNNDADLINLVVLLQNSSRNKAKIQYAQKLLENITEEGIRSSVLSKSEYVKSLDTVTPNEIAIDLYLYTLLYAGEYELYVSEFVNLYPQLSYKMQSVIDALAPDIYWQTENTKVLDAGISAYSKLADTTSDEILKTECVVQADLLKEMENNTTK